jgi:hypothetical protein
MKTRSLSLINNSNSRKAKLNQLTFIISCLLFLAFLFAISIADIDKSIGATINNGEGNLKSTTENVYINGLVKGIQNNNPLDGAKVVIIKDSNGNRVDSTLTNNLGQYNMNIIWTEIQNQLLEKENKIYPNPSQGQTNIDFFSSNKDNYNLLISDVNGRIVLNAQIPAEKGNNKLTLNGGDAGAYFILLTNGENTHKYKSIIATSTGTQFNYSLTTNNDSQNLLKSTLEDILMVGDQVTMEFSKDGYILGDTTFILAPTQTINKNLEQIPYLFTTTLKPVLDNGAPVTTLSPGWTTTFEFPAPVGTKTYTPNGNNEIVIQEEFYPLNGELGNVTIHHDTTDYFVNGTFNGVLSWIVLREQDQSTAVRNKAQTNSAELLPESTTTTALNSLDGLTLNYYMLPKNAEGQPGVWYNMTAQNIRGLMASSGDGLESSKFIQVPPYVHVVLMKTVYDNDNTKFPTQANMDRAINEYNKGINLTNMLNNDNITQPTQFFYTNMNDSIWTAVQARTPVMDNTLVLAFKTGGPSVDRFWTNTYTYDGEARLYYSKAKYPESASTIQIFTENYSATYGITEGTGGLGYFVYNSNTGEPTDLAGRMGRWVKILDLGSGSRFLGAGGFPLSRE